MSRDSFSLRSGRSAAYHKALPKFPEFENILVISTPKHREAYKQLTAAFEEVRKRMMNVLELGDDSSVLTPGTSTATGGGTSNPTVAFGLAIGSVISGLKAAASITGVAPNQLLNLVLPKGDNGSNGTNGTNGNDLAQGWVRNVTTNRLHQVLVRANEDGDAELYLEPKAGVLATTVNFPRADGTVSWANIGNLWYALKVRNNSNGDAEPFLDDATACPDLYLTLLNIDATTIKLRARNNVDGEPEPFLSTS